MSKRRAALAPNVERSAERAEAERRAVEELDAWRARALPDPAAPLDADALARQLAGSGTRSLVVVLNRVADQPAALICEGPIR